MSFPIFSYTLSRGGSGGGVNPHVVWRLPTLDKKVEREEGLNKSQQNIDFLSTHTILYHSRAERSVYLATVINKNFVNSTYATHAMYEFITGARMPAQTNCIEALTAARYAINYQDPEVIVDLRKLNARMNNPAFDPLWACMAEIVEGRVEDRQHGKLHDDSMLFLKLHLQATRYIC